MSHENTSKSCQEWIADWLGNTEQHATSKVVSVEHLHAGAAFMRELVETIRRQEDHAEDIDPEALSDDAILSKQDIGAIYQEAQRFRGDREGGIVDQEIQPYELVCSRSEYVAIANNLMRLKREVDAMRTEIEGHRALNRAAAGASLQDRLQDLYRRMRRFGSTDRLIEELGTIAGVTP